MKSFYTSLLMVMLLNGPGQMQATGEDSQFIMRGVLLSVDKATSQELDKLKSDGINTIVLELETQKNNAVKAAAQRVKERGLELRYWIEVGRNPELADAHPEWMASLQGHKEWRRFFPDFPKPKKGETVKNYPWVPIMYKESFDANLARIKKLLTDHPEPKGIFLNDLQGAPSACGCGHPLCRWTTDYGPIKTATRLPDNAAGKFVADVKLIIPQADVIPVWAIECDEPDNKDLCAGVGCFKGTCWKAYTKQFTPLRSESKELGVLLLYRELKRDVPRFGKSAEWISQALSYFKTMPEKHNTEPVAMNQVVAILQGWDVTDDEVQAQIDYTRKAGVTGYVLARKKIDQSWEPKMLKIDR
jgi:hypothetical protein